MADSPRLRIPSKKEFDTLLEDCAFVDYFNVYLNQPVFGQRVLYRYRHKDFIVDPPLQQERYKVFQYEVGDWLRTNRFSAFVQSDLFIEYNLCCRLRDTRDGFLQHKSGDLQNNKEFWQKTTEFLLGHVMGMQYFRQSLQQTPGETAFSCWMDLEKFRRLQINDPERLKMFHYIRETYLLSGSPKEISLIAKHQAFKGEIDFSVLHDEICTDGPDFMRQLFVSASSGTENFSISNPELFNRLQYVMLVALKSYWLPRYILHVHRSISIPKHKSKALSPREGDMNFFANRTRMRLQSLFPGSLGAESLSITPEDVLVEQPGSTGFSELPTSTAIELSDLLALWGGQRWDDSKLYPTYEDLTTGHRSEASSKSHDNSLWTPASADILQSPNLSTQHGNANLRKFYDSSESSILNKELEDSATFGKSMHIEQNSEEKGNRNNKTNTEPFELSAAVRHLIRGSVFEWKSSYEQQNKRLIASIASDVLAGRPFETYLNTTYAFGSLVFLMLFNDLQEYMRMEPYATDSVGRNTKQLFAAAILKQYRLKPSACHSVFAAKEQEALCRALKFGTQPEALVQAQDLCIQALKPSWQAFTSNDQYQFFNKVTRRSVMKLSPTNHVMGGDLREVVLSLDKGSTYMWTALELAALCRFPSGLKPEYNIREVVSMREHGLVSLGRPVESVQPFYNDKVREMVSHKKFDIHKLRVSRFSEYQRPKIPEIRVPDRSGLQFQTTGVAPNRPPKPRCFLEVLTNYVQFEYFKRFLVLKRAAAPLLFWKQVQDMKETKNPRQRIAKIAQIFRRFFSKYAQYGAQLDCNDEIIKQIVHMDRVTASMIVCAQGAVMRSLEKKWYEAYLSTFPEDDVRSPLSSTSTGDSPEGFTEYEVSDWSTPRRSHGKLQTYKLWSKLLRIICQFIRTLKDSRQMLIFWVYLRLQVRRALQNKSSSSTEIKIVLQNRLLVVNKLPQDLLFWVEVAKYTDLVNSISKPGTFFILSKTDEENLRVKANAIISCFLNSDIQPKLQVNITQEAATNVIVLLASRGPTRSMFHESMMSIFPILFHYFRNCCEEFGLKREDTNLDELLATKMAELEELKTPEPQGSPHAQTEFPDYLQCQPSDIKKVIGPRGDEFFRIQFSISTGIRMIVPMEGLAHRHRMAGQEWRRGTIFSPQGSRKALREKPSKEKSSMSGRHRIGSVAPISRAFSTRPHPLPEAESEESIRSSQVH